MKKVTYCLMALLITLIVCVATVEAATEIIKLPWTIATQGSYIINQNLKANWHGIKVQANNVTIDLNGYSIAGNNASGGYGVYMNGRSNVEIRNGTIRNFGSTGIYEEGDSGNSHRIINVRVINNKGSGIYLNGSNHMVKDCTVSNNGFDGIYAADGCTVSGNTAYSNGNNGISAGVACMAKNNTAYHNQYYGILLGGYNLVDGNTAYDNNQSGGEDYTNISECATCVFGSNVQ